jgi:hypothetical protein
MNELGANNLTDFFSQLAFKLAISKRAQKHLDVYLATGLNIVRDYIDPDENRLSDILRDLLNPDGPHGQGPVLIDNFLRQVGLSNIRMGAEPESLREHCISSGRRIDVLLTWGNEVALGIENKPEAGDLPNQVKDYCEFLERKFAKYHFFYLTRSGVDPSVDSIDEQRRTLLKNAGILRCISFQKEIKDWLEACFRDCKAEKIRWFLRDLIDFIDERFTDRT